MEINGKSMEINGNQWKSMEINGKSIVNTMFLLPWGNQQWRNQWVTLIIIYVLFTVYDELSFKPQFIKDFPATFDDRRVHRSRLMQT